MKTAASRKSLASFWAEPAFAAGGNDFLRVDVAIGAMARGDWSAFERRLNEGLAAVARAKAEGVNADADAVDQAATGFRYDRDLISGEEVNAWLEEAGFGAADWTAYFARDILRRRFEADLDATIDRYPVPARQLLDAAHIEGVCSGQFHMLERTLAHHVALALDADKALLSSEAEPADLAGEASRLAHVHRHWLENLPADEVRHRFVRALQIERGFTATAQVLTGDDALHAILETRQMDWTRLAIESLSLATEHAAREALLCMTVDGLALDDVGVLARRGVRRTSLFLEDLPSEQRMKLLSADTGRPIGPLPTDEGFDVVIVTEHMPPRLDDPRVRERATRAAIGDAAERTARERISWRTRG